MNKLSFFLVSLLIAAGPVASAQTVQVAAAANLQSVLTTKIIPAFEAKTHITVVPVFGATKTLEQQFENGAPYEVFISADTTTVDKLADEHLVDKASVKPYAIGTLVIWYLNSAPSHPASIAALTDPKVQHIAVANPKTAPYGTAAMEAIASSNLTAALTPKIVFAENIQQALQYGVTGNADVSFTALSLVIDRKDGAWTVVPESLHKPIEQSEGVAANASPAAKKFADFLTSKDADKIWSTSGYHVPKK
jgi:molybdate transport system substrate-binding protein